MPGPQKWLQLIHQIPAEPNSLRVKIWRRLQQLGAIQVKQSVYITPALEPCREALSWILKEVVAGGGEGAISELSFLEGLTDAQVITMFQEARKADYEKLIIDGGQLLTDLQSGTDQREFSPKAGNQLRKLEKRLTDIIQIDFFKAPERGTAELLIKKVGAWLEGEEQAKRQTTATADHYRGRVWVTRRNVFVDRLACSWLIRRMIDTSATIRFVGDGEPSGPHEVRFDMFEGEFTHQGEQCSFEVMAAAFAPGDQAAAAIAEIVHDLDMKDEKYCRPETEGIMALLSGLVASQQADEKRVELALPLFDHLYACFQRRREM